MQSLQEQAIADIISSRTMEEQTVDDIISSLAHDYIMKDGMTNCWGGVLSGNGGVHCCPDFQQGKGHFKNKFCAHCRKNGIQLPAERVRLPQPGSTPKRFMMPRSSFLLMPRSRRGAL